MLLQEHVQVILDMIIRQGTGWSSISSIPPHPELPLKRHAALWQNHWAKETAAPTVRRVEWLIRDGPQDRLSRDWHHLTIHKSSGGESIGRPELSHREIYFDFDTVGSFFDSRFVEELEEYKEESIEYDLRLATARVYCAVEVAARSLRSSHCERWSDASTSAIAHV